MFNGGGKKFGSDADWASPHFADQREMIHIQSTEPTICADRMQICNADFSDPHTPTISFLARLEQFRQITESAIFLA